MLESKHYISIFNNGLELLTVITIDFSFKLLRIVSQLLERGEFKMGLGNKVDFVTFFEHVLQH